MFNQKRWWIRISNFIIILNIICVIVILFLIYDLSKKRLFNQEFWWRLESLYVWQKSYVNKDLGLCADDEEIIEFQLEDWENKESKIKWRWFFYQALSNTHNELQWKKLTFKEDEKIFDYSNWYKKNEVELNLQDIKTFIELLWKFWQETTIINKFQADEIVNLSSLYYDHLFWSIFSEKETIKLKINKNNIFNLVLKNWNIQTKIITYISKTEKKWKQELIVSFFDLSEFNNKNKNIEQFIITEQKNWKYKLMFDWESSIITKSSKNYKNIQLLFDFQNITTCFNLEIDYNND